ncbi:MAG: class I SAM-dependent methyltransferase [Bacteroidota bacterium]|nr:class I SAM-dependent methyltransferase [Bacteroidota bacterium]
MESFEKKKHWEKIYQTKEGKDVSWYEPTPVTSLSFLKQFNIAAAAKIIDIGGGDSFFIDNLLDLGFQDITVLDISEKALERAKARLGDRAHNVKWIVSDVATFQPIEQYDFWHDRATFHFSTRENEIDNYLTTVHRSLKQTGILVMGTFSEEGPNKCSGLDIRQYSETTMTERLARFFEKIKCITVVHLTPFDTIQNFIFCSFRKAQTAL